MPRLLTVKGCEIDCSSLSKLLTSFCDLVSCSWLSLENMTKKQNGLKGARGGFGRGSMKRGGGKMRNASAERGGRGQNRGRGHGRGRGGFDNKANRDVFGRGVDKQLFGKKNKMGMVEESKNSGALHSSAGRGISIPRGKSRGNLSTSLKKKVHFADPIEERAKILSQSENESDMDDLVLNDDLEDEEMFEEGNSDEDIEESENKDSEDDEDEKFLNMIDDEAEEDDDDEDKDEADDDDLLLDSDEMDIDEDDDDEDDDDADDDILDSSDSDEKEIYVKKLGSFGEKIGSAAGKKVNKKVAEVAIKSSPKPETPKPEVQEKSPKKESPKNKIKQKNSSITKISVKKEAQSETASLLEDEELEVESVVRNLKEDVRKEKTKNEMKNKQGKNAIEHEESKNEMKNKKVKSEVKNEKAKNEMKIEKIIKKEEVEEEEEEEEAEAEEEEEEEEGKKMQAPPAKKTKLSSEGVQAEKKVLEIEQRRRLKRNKCRLFLKDLPLESSIADVKALSNDIIHVFKPTQKSRFCFLLFANEKICEKNYEKLKNIALKGAKLTVDFMGEKGKNFKPTERSEISNLINPTELYVGDVCSKEEVLQAFPSAGSIQMHDMYAFVKFPTAEAAREAFNSADNVKLGRPIYVFYTRPKEVRPKTRYNRAKKVIRKKNKKNINNSNNNNNSVTGNKVDSKKLFQHNANADGRKRKYEEDDDDDDGSLEDLSLKIFEGDDEELKVDE
ncbi:Replicase polyprotein 1a [Trichinella murrelli]|uniref:Replicase polyprotein 1a n=1 Tax=Trichinella murrelli TaxID=144512 RepID=A0A0V0TR13_9BILA|nr:Replicase polyprotein 1a [Trichinella murrelli]